MNSQILFQHTGSDSSGKLNVFLWVFGMVGMIRPDLLFTSFKGCLVVLCTFVVASGLRSSIIVTTKEVLIVKQWYFMPYHKICAPRIEDVWYDGDWGLVDGASGVVVKVNGRVVHIGSRKTMQYLHDGLRKFTRDDKSY